MSWCSYYPTRCSMIPYWQLEVWPQREYLPSQKLEKTSDQGLICCSLDCLDQGLANFFYKGSGPKNFFKFCGPYMVIFLKESVKDAKTIFSSGPYKNRSYILILGLKVMLKMLVMQIKFESGLCLSVAVNIVNYTKIEPFEK